MAGFLPAIFVHGRGTNSEPAPSTALTLRSVTIGNEPDQWLSTLGGAITKDAINGVIVEEIPDPNSLMTALMSCEVALQLTVNCWWGVHRV